MQETGLLIATRKFRNFIFGIIALFKMEKDLICVPGGGIKVGLMSSFLSVDFYCFYAV